MMRVRLERLAALTLGVDHGCSAMPPIVVDGVTVSFSEIRNVPHKILVIAQTFFDSDGLTGMHDPQVDEARREAEASISLAADVVAVATARGRRLEGVVPFFLVAWPEGTRLEVGDEWTIRQAEPWVVTHGLVVEPALVQSMNVDRETGLVLMSMALSNSNEVGKYLGLCRLFEDAFARSVYDLRKPLNTFLVGAGIDYFRREIDTWFVHRDAAAHGDLARSSYHTTDEHVGAMLQRMEQAAFDVLLNKCVWHNPDPGRRHVWLPGAMVGAEAGRIYGTVGGQFGAKLGLLDPFTKWPVADDVTIDIPEQARHPTLSASVPLSMEVLPPRPASA